jgi:hypothetical protein
MTMAADTPHAESLQVVISDNGKWTVFVFKVGEEHARVSMDTPDFLKAFEHLFSALNSPALSALRAPDLPTYGYHDASVALKVRQVLASITPLGEDIILSVELPGAVLMGLQFPKADIPKLQRAVEEAVELCENQTLTKQ